MVPLLRMASEVLVLLEARRSKELENLSVAANKNKKIEQKKARGLSAVQIKTQLEVKNRPPVPRVAVYILEPRSARESQTRRDGRHNTPNETGNTWLNMLERSVAHLSNPCGC